MIHGETSNFKSNAAPVIGAGNQTTRTICIIDCMAKFPVWVVVVVGMPLLFVSLYSLMELVGRGVNLDDDAVDIFTIDGTHSNIKRVVQKRHNKVDGWSDTEPVPSRMILIFYLKSRDDNNVSFLSSESSLRWIRGVEKKIIDKTSGESLPSTLTRYFYPSQRLDGSSVLDGNGDLYNQPLVSTIQILNMDPAFKWYHPSNSMSSSVLNSYELRSEFVFGGHNLTESSSAINPYYHSVNHHRDALAYLFQVRFPGIGIRIQLNAAFSVLFNVGYYQGNWLILSTMMLVLLLVWISTKSLFCAVAAVFAIIIQTYIGTFILKLTAGRLEKQSHDIASVACQFITVPLATCDTMTVWQQFCDSGEIHNRGKKNTLTVPHRLAYTVRNSYPPICFSLLSRMSVSLIVLSSKLRQVQFLESVGFIIFGQTVIATVLFGVVLPACIIIHHYHLSGDPRMFQKQKEAFIRLRQGVNNKTKNHFNSMVMAMRDNYKYNGCGGSLASEVCVTCTSDVVGGSDGGIDQKSELQHNESLILPRLGLFWGIRKSTKQNTQAEGSWSNIPSETHLLRRSRRKQLPSEVIKLPLEWTLVSSGKYGRLASQAALAANSTTAERSLRQINQIINNYTFDNDVGSPRQTCARSTNVITTHCRSGEYHRVIYNHFSSFAGFSIKFKLLPQTQRDTSTQRTAIRRIPQVTEVLCDVFSNGADGRLFKPENKTPRSEKRSSDLKKLSMRSNDREGLVAVTQHRDTETTGCARFIPCYEYWKVRLKKDAPKRKYVVFGKRVNETQQERDRRIISTEINRPSPPFVDKVIDSILPVVFRFRCIVVGFFVIISVLLLCFYDLDISSSTVGDLMKLMLSSVDSSATLSYYEFDYSCGPDCLPTEEVLQLTSTRLPPGITNEVIDTCDPLVSYHRHINACGRCVPQLSISEDSCIQFDCSGVQFGMKTLNSCGGCVQKSETETCVKTLNNCDDEDPPTTCGHGYCHNNTCVCNGSWIGQNCDECPETCSQHGSCPTESIPTCSCRGSWQGKYCDFCPGYQCDPSGNILGCDGKINSSAVINSCGVCGSPDSTCKYNPELAGDFLNRISYTTTILVHNTSLEEMLHLRRKCVSWNEYAKVISCPLLYFESEILQNSSELQKEWNKSPRSVSRDMSIIDQRVEWVVIKVALHVSDEEISVANFKISSTQLEKERSEEITKPTLKKIYLTAVVVLVITIYGIRVLSFRLCVCALISAGSCMLICVSIYNGIGWKITSIDYLCLFFGIFYWTCATTHSIAGYQYELDFSRHSLLSRKVTRFNAVSVMLKRTASPIITSALCMIGVCISLTFSDLGLWFSLSLRLFLLTIIIVVHTQFLFPCLLICIGPTALFWPAHSNIMRLIGTLLFMVITGVSCLSS